MQLHKKWKLFKRFMRFLLPYKAKWIYVLILSIIGSLLALVNPYLMKFIVDDGLAKKDLRVFIILSIIGAVIFAAGAFIRTYKDFLQGNISLKVLFDMSKTMCETTQGFPLKWFRDRTTGEQLYKIHDDVGHIRDFTVGALPQAVSLFPRLLITIGIVFYLNWKMAIITLLLVPFLYITPYYFAQLMEKAWRRFLESSQNIMSYLEEGLSRMHLIKAFGKESDFLQRYLNRMSSNIAIAIERLKLSMASGFASEVIARGVTGLIILYGGYLVISGSMTLGVLTAIMVYLMELVGLQGRIGYFYQEAVLGLVSCERIAEILDYKSQPIEDDKKRDFNVIDGKTSFKDVTFGYREDEQIFNNLSFSIPSSGMIALAGPSGCGKTTLFNLMLRLYEPQEGDVVIDQDNLKDVSEHSLRKKIGIALQQPLLWNDTIANNIRYGNTDASYDDVLKAARLTGIDDFIHEIDKGYDAVIGENACKLSEGQKQKISIARALIKKPEILLLDEAMSAMDSESESKIINNIKNLPIKVVLVVSHRLSTILACDKVCYLKDKSSIAIGSPADIINRDQQFKNLFAAQLDRGKAEIS